MPCQGQVTQASKPATTHARLGSKVRGGRDGGSSVLVSSRSTRISGSHPTSNKKLRQLDLRVPRRPRTFARLVRKRTTSKVSYHAQLYGYAFSRIKSTPYHHLHALRCHARAKSLGLLSPPHSSKNISTSHHGRAPNERGLSLVQCPCLVQKCDHNQRGAARAR